MKGKIFRNKYGKLSLRGEDGNFYLIGKSLQHHSEGAEIEFEVTESEWQGKTQKWANAIKDDEETVPAEVSQQATENTGVVRLINGLTLVLKEQQETNRLLRELISKQTPVVAPVRTKPSKTEDLAF